VQLDNKSLLMERPVQRFYKRVCLTLACPSTQEFTLVDAYHVVYRYLLCRDSCLRSKMRDTIFACTKDSFDLLLLLELCLILSKKLRLF